MIQYHRYQRANYSDARKEYSVTYERLTGGLNLWELDYRLKPDESPKMRNLYWRDGVLTCRDGQEWVNDTETDGKGYAMCRELFHDCAFMHIGDKIYYQTFGQKPTRFALCSDIPENRGTFFLYDDKLYYKNAGSYKQISFLEETVEFTTPQSDPSKEQALIDLPSNSVVAIHRVTVNDVETTNYELRQTDNNAPVLVFDTAPAQGASIKVVLDMFELSNVPAYTPTILINTNPETCAGTESEPENRLSFRKRVMYNTKYKNGDTAVTAYKLPVGDIDSAGENIADVSVSVRDVPFTQVEATNPAPTLETKTFYVEKDVGVVHFLADDVKPSDPAVNNEVVIEYSATPANTAPKTAIDQCRFVEVYGADTDLCIVMAGCAIQPNAYFWNGSNVVMDPGYFPMLYYNLAGDASEAITGFGKQQKSLVIFKEHSIGRTALGTMEIGTTETGVYTRLTMDYVPVNAKIGCDLPWTIELIENNLVFANRADGVHILLSTSSAYENNVQKISRKIEGTPPREGLKQTLRSAQSDLTCSFDDGQRYWIVSGGEAYVWDYELSAYTDPSWFYFTNIAAVSFVQGKDAVLHMDGLGRLTRFTRNFCDYDKGIDKVYRFATQHFGSYDRLKDVYTMLFTVRTDTDTDTAIKYICDYGEWVDETPIKSGSWHLVPRNLTTRNLAVPWAASVHRRRPGLRHIRHFSTELSNSERGQDMSIVSAQVFFKYQGRERGERVDGK